jgi:hypothetical protein
MSNGEAPPYNKPMGQTTAGYGASLREDVRARRMTNAQAQAAHNAFVKAQMSERGMSPAQAAALQSTLSKAAQGAKPPEQVYQENRGQPESSRGFFGFRKPTQVTSPSMGGVKPGFQNPPSMQLTPPKSSAPYMPTATAPSGPAPAGPPTTPAAAMRMKKGGKVSKPVKKMAKGGSTASSRGDGCAVRGKTKGMMR